MVAVMLSYFTLTVEHWPYYLAYPAVTVAVVALAILEERLVVRPCLKRTMHGLGWFIATLGFALILRTVVTLLYGNNPPNPIPSPLPYIPIRLGQYVSIEPQTLLAIGALIIMVLAVEEFYRRTWMGRAMRASSQDRELAAIRCHRCEPGFTLLVRDCWIGCGHRRHRDRSNRVCRSDHRLGPQPVRIRRSRYRRLRQPTGSDDRCMDCRRRRVSVRTAVRRAVATPC